MTDTKMTYLALGDSYTIGEGVLEAERYPNQLVKLLAEEGIDWDLKKIIARTGWTTDELQKGIDDAGISDQTYDWVTLLIGVNNQYRGRDVTNFKKEFEELLEQAITFAKGRHDRVIVISIPDWGITPFATGRNTDQKKVTGEIDAFNASKEAISTEKGVVFMDITTRYREVGALPESLVEDQLHPSALIYAEWAADLKEIISKRTRMP
ncbi:SGNH/GDSL hydrolase family protein [Pararhodonellum marinum]|uniref:SGNH/GDSL hydrolase family protein n=1 Tax=Pararhodonellum marinum TaxID=2755358 RepID=UPI00188EDCE6|nr:SGNH/GDSL hydrolase family protein [Pararhodonellum marinum]